MKNNNARVVKAAPEMPPVERPKSVRAPADLLAALKNNVGGSPGLRCPESESQARIHRLDHRGSSRRDAQAACGERGGVDGRGTNQGLEVREIAELRALSSEL